MVSCFLSTDLIAPRAQGEYGGKGPAKEAHLSQEERVQRRAAAAASLNLHEHRNDGEQIVNSLEAGLHELRDALYTRIHADVEQEFGMDSMLSPLSLVKSEARTKAEINIYQIAESAAEARASNYASGADDWFVRWLATLCLGEQSELPAVVQRLSQYVGKSADDRRRTFSTVLERTLPEARHAPLIVYRLLPLAVAIVTAVAFGDHARATDARKRQTTLLPNIPDCHQCHGNLLDNGEQCASCGNPMWKYDWLTAE